MRVSLNPHAEALKQGAVEWVALDRHRIRVTLDGTPETWFDIFEADGKLVIHACEPIAVHPDASNLIRVRVVGFDG